jgi:hypothetical protein
MFRLVGLGWLLCVVVHASAVIAGPPSRAEACKGVKPDSCGGKYEPVCASHGGLEERLYTNACIACREENVMGLRTGECPEPAVPAGVERHRVPLDGLTGRLTEPVGQKVVAVDLGTSEPVRVVRAWFRIEGQAHTGMAAPARLVIDDKPSPIPVLLQVSIQDSFANGFRDVKRPSAQLGELDGRFRAEVVLAADRPLDPWRMLVDGRTQLEFAFGGLCLPPCVSADEAYVDVERAELIVDTVPAN